MSGAKNTNRQFSSAFQAIGPRMCDCVQVCVHCRGFFYAVMNRMNRTQLLRMIQEINFLVINFELGLTRYQIDMSFRQWW